LGLCNFGPEGGYATIVLQADPGSALAEIDMPQRERRCFEDLRRAVHTRPHGGGLYITTLDSTHFDYAWPHDFEPPFADYDETIHLLPYPSSDDVRRLTHRYWNAVAWVDSEIEAFCDFLKSEDRYDDSIVVVTADHGEEFHEHGSWFHSSALNAEQTAVPILIKWPKWMGRGPSQSSASHLDVLPTLMYALGLSPETKSTLAGVDLRLPSGPHTSISTSFGVGSRKETIVLRRDGWEAAFSNHQAWIPHVPRQIILTRLRGPDGTIGSPGSASYGAALRKVFPDAFERFFDLR
jgi:hypothetical protein